MKAMHDFAMADPENCDLEWAACVALAKERMAAPVSSPTSSTSRLHHQARATTAVMTAPSTTRSAATLRAPSGAASSEPSTATPAPISAPAVSTENGLTPGARRIYDYLVGNSDYLDGDSAAPVPGTSYAFSDLEAVHGAVDITNSDFAASMPTNCLFECPSNDDDAVPVSMFISPAKPSPSTTSSDVLSELATLVTAPMVHICSPGSPDDSSDREDHMATFLTSWSAHPSFNVPPKHLPILLSARMGVLELFTLSSSCSTDRSDDILSAVTSALSSKFTMQSSNIKQQWQVLRLAPWPSLIGNIHVRTKPVTNNQPKPPWFLLAPTIHTSELMSTRTDSGYLYIGGLLFELDFCARFRPEAHLPAWVLSFSVGHVIQYGSERNCQTLQYNGLTLQYCSYKGINSETTTHYVSASFIWSIAWFQLLLLLHPLGLCLNMPMGDVVLGCHSPTLFIAEMRPACFQLDQLARANLAAMVYMFAYAATMCHQFSSGFTLLRPAAASSAMDSYSFLGLGMMAVFIPGLEEAQLTVQTTNFNSTRPSSWKAAMLVVKQGTLMSCNLYVWSSFEMELLLDGYDRSCLAGLFIQRDYEPIQWIFLWFFSCPVLVDCLTVVVAGFDVLTLVCLAMKCNLGSPPELPSNSTIELKPWPSWEMLSCIVAVIRSVGAFDMFASSVFIWKGIYSRPTHYIQFIIEGGTIFDSRYFEWHIPWESCSASAHWKMNFALLFSWDMTSTVDSVLAINSNSSMFSYPLQVLELGNYFTMAVLLLSSNQSEALVLYLPTTSTIQCGYELMLCEIASTKDGILTKTKRVLMSWDPGGPIVPDAVTVINRKSIHLPFAHLTWDPGGYVCNIGLRASRILRKGDCQRPTYVPLLGWPMCCNSWAWPARRHTQLLHIRKETNRKRVAWNRTDGLGLEGEDRLGLACVACSLCVHLLPLDSPNPRESFL